MRKDVLQASHQRADFLIGSLFVHFHLTGRMRSDAQTTLVATAVEQLAGV